MAELKNVFSWSFSAAEDFEECRRRRYWAKYAMWGGWEAGASDLQRKAYRLCKMENLFSIRGNAVEKAVMWALREKQAGRTPGVEEAYEARAKPYLNGCWSESLQRKWEINPKKYCCLREHYYGRLDTLDKQETQQIVGGIIRSVKLCISNFIQKVLPSLSSIAPEQEVKVAAAGSGDPESFELGGVKVYAIPDYVYLADGGLRIHDWKSGKKHEKHLMQMELYALWAAVRYGMAADHVRGYLEYLASGETLPVEFNEQTMATVREKVAQSVSDMAAYLVGGDIAKNEPLPPEDWEMTDSADVCGKCSFMELCKPELDRLR